MKVSHLVSAVLVSVVVMLAGNLLVSHYSSEGYAALDSHRIRLEANIEELIGLQATLQGRVELLTRSSDAVRVAARDLGYYAENDTVIRIANASPPPSLQSPGRVILGVPGKSSRRTLVRLIAVLSGAATLVVLLLVSHPVPHKSISRPSR
jgi:septum formation initiator